MKNDILYLGVVGECFLVDLHQVLYIQADDHYSHIHYGNGLHFMVPFGISRLEKAVERQMGEDSMFRRIGRKYIVNLDRVFHINVPRQSLQYFDSNGNVQTLTLPKPLLQGLVEYIRTRHPGFVLTPTTEFEE